MSYVISKKRLCHLSLLLIIGYFFICGIPMYVKCQVLEKVMMADLSKIIGPSQDNLLG